MAEKGKRKDTKKMRLEGRKQANQGVLEHHAEAVVKNEGPENKKPKGKTVVGHTCPVRPRSEEMMGIRLTSGW